MKLTYRERASLAHLFFLFPFLYVAIYPDTLASMDPELIKMWGMLLILVGTAYHVFSLLARDKHAFKHAFV
jgi:hypothetical protein